MSEAAHRSNDTVADVLARQAGAQAHAALLIGPSSGQVLRYGELAALTLQWSCWFDRRGIARGEHVGMLLPNGVAASAIFLATMAAGRVIVPLSLVAQASQLRYVLRHCEARCVLTDAEHAAALVKASGEDDAVARIVVIDPDAVTAGPWTGDGDVAAGAGPTAVSPDQGALLMYTSGTTGVPKGVPLTHRNLLHAARAVVQWHGLGPSDRVLSALPLYHINGQVIATLAPFVSGGSIVAPSRFSVSTWWHDAHEHGCTWLNMVPTIIAYLLAAPDQRECTNAGTNAGTDRDTTARTTQHADADPVNPSRIRFGRSASAPLPPDHHQAFERRFGFPVIEAMGMTESASVVFCNPMPPARRRSGTPGLPIGVEVKIIDADGADVPDGVSGEICLRGPSVMPAYFRSPEQSADAFTADGWLRSGDLGRREADGFHFITGRLKELIIKGGENIAPREIDEALLGHPAILEAAAVGIPDAAYGQDILAAVVLRPGAGLDEAQLRRFCERELGRYKTPRVFRFVTALPKGASGKVQRLKLLDDDHH